MSSKEDGYRREGDGHETGSWLLRVISSVVWSKLCLGEEIPEICQGVRGQGRLPKGGGA